MIGETGPVAASMHLSRMLLRIQYQLEQYAKLLLQWS